MSDQNGNLDSPNLFRSNRRRLSPLSNESGTSAICEDELTGTIEGSCIQSENQCIQRGPDLLLPVPPNIVDVQNLDHHKRLHPGADCSGSLQPSQATTENIISEESSTHCSICFELFDDQVIVMPCGHQFDIACLKLWLKYSNGTFKHCPLCRRPIIEIQGGDEEILPPLTNREQRAALEMFPLRLRPDAEVQYGPVTTMEICIRNETHYILAKREIELLIRRQALETTSCLDRNLEFEYIPIEDYERVKRHDPFTVKTDPASLKGYEKAETEAMEMMEKYFNTNPAIGFSEVKFMPNHLWTSERGRGLEQSVYKSIEYCRGSYLPALMRCCTKLNELGPANVDDDPALIMGPSTERENSVQKAREEIQGVLEWFSSQEVDQRQLLNRGSTNLLEPWAGGGYCEYCNLEHRNGDCLLSWDPVV